MWNTTIFVSVNSFTRHSFFIIPLVPSQADRYLKVGRFFINVDAHLIHEAVAAGAVVIAGDNHQPCFGAGANIIAYVACFC